MPTIRKPRCGRSELTRAVALLCLVIPLIFSPAGATESGVDITVPTALVVTSDSIASAVGNAVLLDGGNAVDAAVAVGFALAVTLPRAGNIGGGGFMLVRLTGGEEVFIDYRETAPARASRDMYLGGDGAVVDDLSTVGHLASGVPGTVYGLAEAHTAFGSLPWPRLVEPAIRLARDGFPVSRTLAESLEKRHTRLEAHPQARRIFVAPGYRPGDLMIQSHLAETLERISIDWRDFYTGKTADLIAAEMESGGGLVSKEDLAGYRAVRREPLRFDYGEYSVTSAPLSSSGGVIIAQVLQMLEHHGAGGLEYGSAEYVHLVSEAEKVAYRSRALYLGDIDFYPSPWTELIAPATTARLASLISPESRLKVESLEAAVLLESEQTTHYSIVDRWGNAVANTYTLNGSYGSGVVVAGAGFLMNNEMDDFAIKPGYPNLYGLVGSEANAIEPGKRMLSSMSPTFVDGPDGFFMVLGSPGGSRIPTAVLQVILNVIDHGMPLYQAVSAGRFHEQYLPDRIYIENGALEPAAIDGLLDLGHRIEVRKPMGEVQAILVRDGRLGGASDPRGNGRAIGH